MEYQNFIHLLLLNDKRMVKSIYEEEFNNVNKYQSIC